MQFRSNLFWLLFLTTLAPTIGYSEEFHARLQWRMGKGNCVGRWVYQEFPECRIENHGVESYKDARNADCGLESYRLDRTAPCGVEKYNWRRGPECGVWYYNEGHKLLWRRHSSFGNFPIHLFTDYFRNFERIDSVFGTYIKVDGNVVIANALIIKDERIRDPQFGVDDYHGCEHPDFGVAQYNICRHESHGVENYKSCRTPANGVENYLSKRSRFCGKPEERLHCTDENADAKPSPFIDVDPDYHVIDSAICSTGDHLPAETEQEIRAKYEFLKSRIESYRAQLRGEKLEGQVTKTGLVGPVNDRERDEVISMMKALWIERGNLMDPDQRDYVGEVAYEFPEYFFPEYYYP